MAILQAGEIVEGIKRTSVYSEDEKKNGPRYFNTMTSVVRKQVKENRERREQDARAELAESAAKE